MKFDLSIPKMGYFILVRHDKGMMGNAILLKQRAEGFSITDSEYTHVEVSGGGQWSVNVAPPRTEIIDITKKYKGRYIKIVRYNNNEYQSHRRYKVAFWAASHCNIRYDFRGVFAFVAKYFKQSKNKWFCSENAAWALRKECNDAFGSIPLDKIMPAHFLGKDFILVWEGTI